MARKNAKPSNFGQPWIGPVLAEVKVNLSDRLLEAAAPGLRLHPKPTLCGEPLKFQAGVPRLGTIRVAVLDRVAAIAAGRGMPTRLLPHTHQLWLMAKVPHPDAILAEVQIEPTTLYLAVWCRTGPFPGRGVNEPLLEKWNVYKMDALAIADALTEIWKRKGQPDIDDEGLFE